MRVRATTSAPPETDADTIVIGVFEDEGVAHDYPGTLQALVDSGEARRGLRKLAATHADGRRYVLACLVARGDVDPERARRRGHGTRAAARHEGALLGGASPRRRPHSRRARRGHGARLLRVHAVQERRR